MKHIRDLIARNELRQALQQLQIVLDNSPMLDEAILQAARFADIRKQIRLGLVDHEAASLTQNQIRAGLLELLDEMDAQLSPTNTEAKAAEIRTEHDAAMTVLHSKNVVAGNTITAGGGVHIGDIIQYSDKKIPRHLTPIPFLPEIFLGRETELQAIYDKLFSPGDSILLLVNGEGGVGKTSLASRYFRNYESKYAHLAWVLSENSIANALLLLALPLGITFDDKASLEQRFQLLLQALSNLQKPCLLIIDNANELPDLEANYQQLRQLPNCHLLLTTRITSFGQAATHRIDGLPEAEALQLFQRYYPQFQPESEAGVFKAIREAVGGNTLVVELLAKNLAQLNTGLKTRYTLPDLLRDLQEKGLLKLSQTQAVHTDYQKLHHADPQDIIAAMYDLGGLPPAEVALLCAFSVLPAESITFATLERILPNVKDLDKLLLSLAQKGWIENMAVSDFKCSPVVQEVVKAKRVNLIGDCRALLDALINELTQDKLHLDNYKHSTLFARYAETFVATQNHSDDDLATLCQNLGNFYSDTGDLVKAMLAYQKMEHFQAVLLKENPDNPEFKNGLAISYEKLGETHSALGNLDKALTFFEDETKLFEELYQSYPQNVSFKNGLAISYYKLGQMNRDHSNDTTRSRPYFQQAEVLWQELVRDAPQYVQFQKFLSIVQQDLSK